MVFTMVMILFLHNDDLEVIITEYKYLEIIIVTNKEIVL